MFGKIKLTGIPKSPSVKKYKICNDTISADPICPFPNAVHVDAEDRGVGQVDETGRIVGHHLVLVADLWNVLRGRKMALKIWLLI